MTQADSNEELGKAEPCAPHELAERVAFLRELYRVCDAQSLSPGPGAGRSAPGMGGRTGAMKNSASKKVITIHAPTLPKYNRTSSGLRILQVLKALQPFFDEIRFVYLSQTEFDPVYKMALPENAVPVLAPRKESDLLEMLLEGESDVICFTDLFDPGYIRRCSRLVDSVKSRAPDCAIVLDTMDCHWKKYVRKAVVSEEAADWNAAWNYLKLEEEIYPKSDLLAVVTTDEGNNILKSVSGSAGFEVIPNCYTLSPSLPVFSRTRDLCFVGSAGVNHNLDAMRYMRDEVMPRLGQSTEGCVVHVIGSGWGTIAAEFKGSPFVFHGHVDDLDRELARYRVFVCPLTYGAGLKGKLGSAASAGIPVVTTPIGYEGYPLDVDHGCAITGGAAEFAQACAALLNDRVLWENNRNLFRAMVEREYGVKSMERAVVRLLGQLRAGSPIHKHKPSGTALI